MAVVIGLDLGTTNCKAVALGENGTVLAAVSQAYPLQSTRPGWAEQDPRQVWVGAARALRALADRSALASVAGLCVSGAMHSVLPIGEEGNPLALAMTWADQRAAGCVDSLRSQTDAHALYLRTGCPLRATYHAPRLRWWLEQGAETVRGAARFVAIKDWILHRLTGVWATDWSLASTSGLFDIRSLTWVDEALALAGVPEDRLCPVVSPEEVIGVLTKQAAMRTGLPEGLPVVAGASDGALANVGAGAVDPGQLVVTVGTSGAIRRIVRSPWFDPEERTWCYVLVKERWFAGGAINNGGLALEWVRERFYPELGAEQGYEAMLREAAAVAPGAEGVLMLPYLTGERSPHWQAGLSAVIYGLGLQHTRAHVARAAMEGVAFCLADVWQALAEETVPAQPARLTGGITQSLLWAQIVADVLGIALAPVQVADASALGAAVLGHWALGYSRSLGWRPHKVPASLIQPDAGRHSCYQRQHQAFQDLSRLVARGPRAPQP